MSNKKCCKKCKYSFHDDWGRRRCQWHLDSDGDYARVSDNAVCNSFNPRDTTNQIQNNSSGCFLTSACVKYFGLPDNCVQLTKLRWYRDKYLKSTKEGNLLIEEYYALAPKIVEKIEEQENKNEFYQYIYLYIEKCVMLIDENKYSETLQCYQEMVNSLQKQLL